MDEIASILDAAVESLKTVPGVVGVVLGGSRARGTNTDKSDIDIGIYYNSDSLDLTRLETVAEELDDGHRENLIAGPGGWGRWVNGGSWRAINGCPVDFILRDIGRVGKMIAECREGVFTAHYQTGHPHAFMNAMYMGELAVCKLLWDSVGEVSRLKSIAEIYPPKLKEQIISLFSFEAGFSCMLADKNADDTYYLFAHLARSVSCLNQVLFALNEQYCLNEKKAVRMIEGFSIKPVGYKKKVDSVFVMAGQEQLLACGALQSLVNEVQALVKNKDNWRWYYY
jgi:predicted nucleotidyltransferase